ncbi:uncharacterized protein ATC70_011851 [Mucor velutinosus]|uniref:Response regulatory domain-containing protein n=1 Tax=Mucor velutinosus TaxID=708070 RepID=A0AAN7DAL2_9FUNG|nr:hypothetical protein ATC70_011851 [Mucor velutinosus]
MTDPHSSSGKGSASTTATTSRPITTQKRPRLGYLRSAWTTTDLYYASSFNSTLSKASSIVEDQDEDQDQDQEAEEEEEEEEEEDFYNIKLPSIQLHDYEDETAQEQEKDEIIQEIFRMITVANVLCLSGSIVECGFVMRGMPASLNEVIQHYQDWMPYAILPLYTLWWLFMILVLKNRTEHLRQYLNWTQASAIVMASTNFMLPTQRFYPLFQQQFHTLFVALAILASFIFAFAKRILMANELKQERLKSRVTREHAKLQDYLDQRTLEFSHHRLAFLNTVSQEIQDVALMVITTLEQFSPASILSTTHELLSACSLAVPIASISAINTTIRQVCHVSSHLQLLSKLTVQAWTSTTTAAAGRTASLQLPELNKVEFDIGELLQNIGDALAGVASKLDVNFVIYHCDNSLHHTLVIGDEGAIRHALLNHLRNVLECCTPGACIEVGLNVTDTAKDDECTITFYITHTSSPAIRNASAALLPNANLTAQLLQYIHAQRTVSDDSADDSTTQDTSNQTKFDFSFDLARGSNNNSSKKDNNKMFITKDSYLLKNHYANIKFANEPSLKDLAKFIEHLKELKMVLHAPEQSIFAKHLTSCLASWNTDISHVPVAQRTTANMGMDGSVVDSSSSASSSCVSSTATTPLVDPAANAPPPQQQPVHSRQPSTPPVPSPAIEEEHIHSIPPAFILIDDDIATLENKLAEFRSQPAASANVLQAHHGGRRAAAAAAAAAGHHHPHHHPHHSKKSSTSSPQNFFHQGTTAIIHFTSLTKYKAVRDTIQYYAFLPSRDPFSMPRVVVVPKPAGPRRFLTALHTAWHNSVVEPHFSAIATSPSSPMPPVISMLVQREMAAAAQKGYASVTSPNEASSRMSPNDISPGSNGHRSNTRRPLSGLFSPPANLPPSSSSATAAPSSSPSMPPPANSDTYFTSQQQQDQQLTTPPLHATTSASNSRRKSANAQQEQDYLTAKSTAPLMNALGVVSTSTTSPAAAIAAASIAAAAAAAAAAEVENEHVAMDSHSSGLSSNTLDTISTESPAVGLPVAVDNMMTDSANPEDQASNMTATAENTDLGNSNTITAETAKPKKILSKTMTNFKLNKKKKKAKGTPFTDVVSPPINVLIVEDNIINQAILSAWMKKHKIKFSVASNGKEAVDKWKSGGFHLILMDIQLPVMNGIEATKMIRSIEKEQQIGVLPMSSSFLRQQQQQEQQLQQEPLEVVAAAAVIASAAVNEIKLQESTSSSNNNSPKNEEKPSIFRSPVIIVALTASSLESDRHAALAAGCNDFLTKPVSLEWLEKKIIEWGCMQALIDFEGWRRWKRNTNSSDEKIKLTPAAGVNNTTVNNEQFEAERKRIEALAKKKNVPGVLLPGVSNLTKNARRSTVVSQMDDTKRRKRPSLKPSKSDSDTQHVSSRMTKRNHHNTKSQSETTTTTTTTIAAAAGSVPLNRSRSTSREKNFDNDS